ncbi:MAG TPA: hypothetical protein GX691_02115, partial [Clostridia bacterium]|nr:hypothetical protein [Clostridia bacterium]
IRLPQPFGLEPPESRLNLRGVNQKEKAEKSFPMDGSVSGLAWLYDIEGYFGKRVDLEIISGYGENNEIREVIRHIAGQETGFDEVAVFYTWEFYSQLFYDISREYGIPVTFGSGVSIHNSTPGQVLFGLLKFLESNFDVSELYPLLNSRSLIPDTGVSGFQVVRCLRKAGIGWGKERYSLQLDRLLEGYESSRDPGKWDHADQGERDKAGDKGSETKSFPALIRETRDFINGLLGLFPDFTAENCIPLGQLSLGLAEAIDRYSNITGEADAEAREKIIQELQALAESVQSELPCDEAVKVLQEIIENIRIQKSLPRPGHLHVDSFSKGIWINRKRTYMAGLSSDRFPGSGREDAILLDAERTAISPDLKLGRDRSKEKVYSMAELLAVAAGPVVLSFPCFNTVENKELFPASILLQAFRLYAGDPRKDYSDLEAFVGTSRGFVPAGDQTLLDENEWWLRRQTARSRTLLAPVLRAFPNLARGAAAWKKRALPDFSFFDGKIPAERNLLDPRINHEMVLSPSGLETLARCPFSYFLRHVLRVKPLEEIIYDPGIWLDGAQRGTLLHEIFEAYFKTIVQRNEKPNFSAHREFLYELADEALNRARQAIPPPNDAVYDYECGDILESCRVFLRSEEAHAQEGVPVWFEFSFGKRTDAGADFEEPVYIEYKPGVKFALRGSIDRVDKIGPNSFLVLDYKTGSTYSYSVWEPFKGGRQLQYAIYALALETVLRERRVCPGAVVNEGGYIFPSTKGEGQRIIYKPIDREALTAVLDSLFEIMGSGCFNMSDSSDDCRFCDYQAVCLRDFLEEALTKKLEAPDLEHFWEVRSFD